MKTWLIIIAVFLAYGAYTLTKPSPWIECWKRGGDMQYGLTGWYKSLKCNAPTVQEGEK